MTNENTQHPIYIIGAGIAGLSCAQTLQQAGKKVIVLEASERMGGRIHSLHTDTATFDLGASWIHGIQHNPIWDITQNYNIQTTLFNYNHSVFYHENGLKFTVAEQHELELAIEQTSALIDVSEHACAIDAVIEIIQNFNFKNKYLAEPYLKTMVMAYFQHFANDPFATELEQLSTHYRQYEGYFEGDEVIFPHGYDQIITAISENLRIQTQTQICNIIQHEKQVSLVDQNGKTYDCTQVVIAVPLGVLKQGNIQFVPPLADAYQQAIQDIGFGSFNKVFIELEQSLISKETTQNSGISYFYWQDGTWCNILDVSELYQKPLYLILFGGKQSEFIDQATHQQVEGFIQNILNKIAQQKVEIKNITFTQWGKNIYSYGSFSFPTPEYSEALVQTFNQSIADTLFFAGEHCSAQYAGTVHGAYLSGYETAQQILATKK